MQPTEPFPAQPEPAIEPSVEPSPEPVAEPSAEPARPASRPNRALDATIALALFAATFAVYFVSMRLEGPTPYNFHVLLANAIVNGQVNLPQLSWLELAEWQGKFYTVFPPGPALLLTPIAYFWGPGIDQQFFSVAIGALNVLLCYATLRTLFQSRAGMLPMLVLITRTP